MKTISACCPLYLPWPSLGPIQLLYLRSSERDAHRSRSIPAHNRRADLREHVSLRYLNAPWIDPDEVASEEALERLYITFSKGLADTTLQIGNSLLV